MEKNITLHNIPEWKTQLGATLHDQKKTWPQYLTHMRKNHIDADELVLRTLAFYFQRDIIILSKDSWYAVIKREKEWPFPINTPPLTIAYLDRRHFEPIERISEASQLECRGCTFQGETLRNLRGHLENKNTLLPCRLFYTEMEITNMPSIESETMNSSEQECENLSNNVMETQCVPHKRMSSSCLPKNNPPPSPQKRVCRPSVSKEKETPSTPFEKKCKGCGQYYMSLLNHLSKGLPLTECTPLYDINELVKEAEIKTKTNRRVENCQDENQSESEKSSSGEDLSNEGECRGCQNYYASLRKHLRFSPTKCISKYNEEELKELRLKVEHERNVNRRVMETTSEEDSPFNSSKTECKQCGKKFKYLLKHLTQQKPTEDNCASHYDMDKLKEISRLKQISTKNKNQYKTNSEKRRTTKTKEQRYQDFHKSIKDTWSVGCYCCHQFHNSGTWYTTKDKLFENINDNLKKLSFVENNPWESLLKYDEGYFLCRTCSLWLFQKKQLPPVSANNNLEVVPVHEIFKDFNDLELTLIQKNILFIRIHKMPKNFMRKVTGRSVNIPLMTDEILKQINDLKSPLPRDPGLPEKSGIICVQLKRKLEYKNHHVRAWVRQDKLLQAVQILKEKGHPAYQDVPNIPVNNRFEVLQDTEMSQDEDEVSEEEQEDEINHDPIRRNQFDLGGATTMTDVFPETSVVIEKPHQKKTKRRKSKNKDEDDIQIAPGEGKIPTDLMRDENFDVKAFAHLYSDGKNGLDHPDRKKKLSAQKLILAKLRHISGQFGSDPLFLFAMHYYIERLNLERNINLSWQRGKIIDDTIENLHDVFSIFDNVKGSGRYWLQQRYQVLAKLEQLGPFHLFFTLSCADKRWDENFVSILRQKGLKITYESTPPKSEQKTEEYDYEAYNIYVQEEGQEKVLLKDYMGDVDHELIRKNVLAITMNFDRRVQAFMKNIVMGDNNPTKTQYYHYRVEFQLRGAGHIHGVLWVDVEELGEKYNGLKEIMNKLKNLIKLDDEEKVILTQFIDDFVTCSLKIKGLEKTVGEVQRHGHCGNPEDRTGCYKKGKTCRFQFPRFPSDRTIIAQPLERNDGETDEDFTKRKKEFKTVLDNVKAVLIDLEEKDKKAIMENKEGVLKSTSIKYILNMAGVTEDEYYEALGYSQNGACVILKREPDEININNYNPEWLKAWDGNMDIAVCLDFFAIITYITDYYTKSETKMMNTLSQAAQACKGHERKEQLKFMAQTFLTHRETGEAEVIYRIMPQLHLSQSNIKCIFIATGFPWNRSRMLIKIKGSELEEGEYSHEEPIPSRKQFSLPGREGKYMEKVSIHEKYAARPAYLDKMCLAQFATYYDMNSTKSVQEDEYIEGTSSKRNDQKTIFTDTKEQSENKKLPSSIELQENLGYMKLRGYPSVLRLHKMREDLDRHEFMYSNLVLYYPWRKEEEELCATDEKACQVLFEKPSQAHDEKTAIQTVEEALFPFRNSVIQARAAMENFPDTRPSHIGDDLDPENEKENEESAAYGDIEDEDYAARIPDEQMNDQEGGPSSAIRRASFHKIKIPINESQIAEMRKKVQDLDHDQRMVVDIYTKFAKAYRTSQNSSMRSPQPPLIKVQGGAGAGKSTLINTLSIVCEYWLNFGNKDPSKPAVLKTAPTGAAAHVVSGQTLHQALHFPWGNRHISLPDKKREALRNDLEDMHILILDEMSMVKSDLLYQIHLRLQELKQNRHDFGKVAMLLCGDIMQLRPISAAWIFEPPTETAYQASHALHSLWKEFDPIELTHNHRQGEDGEYAELLKRIRILPPLDWTEWERVKQRRLSSAERTRRDKRVLPSDKKLLTSRLINEKLPRPDEAVFIFGKKEPCNIMNNEKLEKLETNLEVIKATNSCKYYKKFKPKVDNFGFVGDTPLLEELKLKIGAKVMLRMNQDTKDGLTNGAIGWVVDFEKQRGKDGIERIITVFVQFEEPDVGKLLREKNQHKLKKHKCPNATPITKYCFEYSLGNKKKDHLARAKVIQFPLTLAWAINAHKCQGMTIRKPHRLVVDMDSCFGAAMVYVALSRIQNLTQLYLMSLDTTRIWADKDALNEMKTMKKEALNREEILIKDPWFQWNNKTIKITSLNIFHLPSRLCDLHKDPTILKSDIICLQETYWKNDVAPTIPEYSCIMSTTIEQKRGKGLVAFIKNSMMNNFDESSAINDRVGQFLRLSFHQYDIINVYKTQQCRTITDHEHFIDLLDTLVEVQKPTIITGDFNFDYWKEKDNLLGQTLTKSGFKQLVTLPTTVLGNCIDHVYINEEMFDNVYENGFDLYYPYYTDHEAVRVILKLKSSPPLSSKHQVPPDPHVQPRPPPPVPRRRNVSKKSNK